METVKKLNQKFIDKLRQYQRAKSRPALSEKYFTELIELFVRAYKRNQKPEKINQY